MSDFKLNLPVDIPWRRKCVSQDMVDRQLCDGEAPLRWRSSIAVFEYEPEAENQNYEGMTISYLKLACTITGYQEDPTEIGIDRKGLISRWKPSPGIENYLEVLQKSYACYGADVEIAVGPKDTNTDVHNYPFFADFEPKKRELYELATDTKEHQSRSIESLNLTKSAGTTQSLEVFDVDMGGGGVAADFKYAGTGGSFDYDAPNGQWGTKRMNAEESLSSRSADVGQEKRETFSFSTQLSQMYHQLDSYHLGTNRAVFFVTSRPHTNESPHTFVNGPRELEGIQEFFLVVARPKGTETPCVEVYLETGHIHFGTGVSTLEDVADSEIKTFWTDSFHAAPRGDDDETTVYDAADRVWEVKNFYPGYKIKSATLTLGNPDVYINESGAPPLIEVPPYISLQNSDLIKVSGRVRSWFENVDVGFDNIGQIIQPFVVDITLVKVQRVFKNNDTLFITGRNLCCCRDDRLIRRDGIVYEIPFKQQDLLHGARRAAMKEESMPIRIANRLRKEIGTAIVNSRTDVANRYDEPVHLPYTNFAAKTLVNQLTESSNVTIQELQDVPETLSSKLARLNPDVKLDKVLSMPFQMQKDVLSLSDAEVVELRSYLSGLNHRGYDPKDAWLTEREQARLFKPRDTGTDPQDTRS